MMLSSKNIPVMDLGDWSNRIKDQLSIREVDLNYFAVFNHLLADIHSGFNERAELIQFHKDILHNKNLFHEDGINIRLGDNMIYKYSSLRKQLYLSLFAMIGGVYDSSARLCMYALNKDAGIKNNCYIHNIFFENNSLTKGHQDVLGPLKKDYGYFLGVIVYLRNLFVHRGEIDLGGKLLFQSNVCSDLDSLNPDVLTEIENKAHFYYEIKKYSNELPLSTFKDKSLIELVNTYLLYTDHAIGQLINSLLAKHVGVV
ncbi:MAG TPA: hypothetical protein VK186_08825 [Candidatus Deferrimicrobium sp.]|nr:hypothetical protein [Candidatus Deferrimicrobium sp.]